MKDIAKKSNTDYLLNKYQIKASKKFGQNFLIDLNIIKKIVETTPVDLETCVIEIGPGIGALTEQLAMKAGKVICFEIDTRLKDVLDESLSEYQNIDIIFQDFLTVDLKKIVEECGYPKVCIVANLPYYITSDILEHIITSQADLQSIHAMVQKEVAERLTETPGGKNTGSITYSINYYTNAKTILEVPKTSFIPSPKVDSSVIKLDVLDNPKIKVLNEEIFFKIVKCAFMQKRKTLINSLSNSGISNKEILENILTELNIDTRIRAEQLTLEQFGMLSDKLSKI